MNRFRGHGRVVRSRFRPHPLLRSGHLQTLLAEVLRPAPAAALRRERFELPDGDFVDLGWHEPAPRHGPLALLVHGVAGGFGSRYARGFAAGLARRGWRPAVLQLRGAGPEPNRLARSYHHGDTEDLRRIARWLRQREPGTPLAAVGWSLGASVVLKAAGEDGAGSPFDAVGAVSAPFSLRACAEHLRRGPARLYQQLMLLALKRGIRRKHARLPVPRGADLAAALAARDFFELGDAYTAPVNGFRDADDYCERAACARELARIRRPTLVLQARDDPFLGEAVLVGADALAADVTVEVSPHGGHVGFIAAGPRGRAAFWADRRLRRFLRRAARVQSGAS